ncbi:TPA: phage major capsid protein [Clostridioides difficile]|nr:phage major capsid protein [Clostridioides difficile]
MGLSLTESAKLSTDMLQKGVILTMAKQSPVLEKLPFMEIVGNGYSYNLVGELPEVGFRAVNTGYTEAGATVSREVEHLVILGGDVDVDTFIAKTRGNVNDIRAIQTELKAKATARAFEKNFFTGDTSSDANAFDGLDKRITKGKGTEIKGALSLDALNELLDAVVDGADVLYMSKKTRRDVMALLQASNHYIENGSDSFGRMVNMYGGIEIRAVEDGLVEDGKIYAIKFGQEQYVCGLTNGGIQVKDLGELETKPCYRTRIEFFCGLAVFHPKAFAVLNTTGAVASAKGKK